MHHQKKYNMLEKILIPLFHIKIENTEKRISEYTRRFLKFKFSILQSYQIRMPPKIDLQKIIGQNIVRIRTEKKISQEKLANLADIDRTYIGYIENGKYNITISKLQQIAEALDVSLNELINEYVK